MRVPSALTIAGSDSGGGAGIQADLKTFAAHGVHGLSAIAALTAQHTRGVTAVEIPPPDFLQAQIDACFDDFRITAVKLGMLGTGTVIDTVADALATRDVPVVVDPVMVATSGARLLAEEALVAMRTRLLPRADLLTPNLPEAELLLGHPIGSLDGMRAACNDLLALGARAILLKGGHLADGADTVIDLLADARGIVELPHPRLRIEAHGTGCTLASSVAARLALGHPLREACEVAGDYVHRALAGGYRPGRGDVRVLDHFGAATA